MKKIKCFIVAYLKYFFYKPEFKTGTKVKYKEGSDWRYVTKHKYLTVVGLDGRYVTFNASGYREIREYYNVEAFPVPYRTHDVSSDKLLRFNNRLSAEIDYSEVIL